MLSTTMSCQKSCSRVLNILIHISHHSLRYTSGGALTIRHTGSTAHRERERERERERDRDQHSITGVSLFVDVYLYLETSVRVQKLILVLSQPAGDRSHKPSGRLHTPRGYLPSRRASPPIGRYQIIPAWIMCMVEWYLALSAKSTEWYLALE